MERAATLIAMSTRRGVITFVALLLLSGTLVMLTNCGGSGSPSSGMENQPTNLSISVSDPPTCAGPSGPFAHIYLTVTDVKIHASADAGLDDSGWVDLTPSLQSSPKQIDFLAQGDNQCFLATLGSTSELQPGTYQQIRIFLADNSVTPPNNACGSTANCVMLTSAPGTPIPLQLSGETRTGIKISSGQLAGGQFTIAAGQTKDLNIDFDACASIVTEGNGRYRLKPVLHAGEVALTSTSINGMVVDSVTLQPVTGGATIVALEQRDSSGVDRVVMETLVDSSGGFVFCPVPAGAYDIVVTAINSAGTAYGPTVITGVQPGNALGTVPVVAETGANTAPASITGVVTTSTGNAATSADVVLSALQSVVINGSNVLVTVPLAQQSAATATVTTAASDTCPANTDCATYTLVVPALNPSVGTFNTSGKQQPSAPGAGPVAYTMDGQAVVPNSPGTPDCSPSDVRTDTAAAGGPLTVTAGFAVTASTLAFTACQ